MNKFLLITIIIVASIMLICPNAESKQMGDDGTLQLNVSGYSAIDPHAFRGVNIWQLQLSSYPDWKRGCTPQFIDLTPELFENLSTITALELICLKFPVNPNPFRSLEALTMLGLDQVDFTALGNEFFTHFPNLYQLQLLNSNITTISPDTFSQISEKLEILLVIGGVSAIKPKSFERFHNLADLHLLSIELTSLSAEMFDGLAQLETLDLEYNDFQVLSPDIFSGLPNLTNLYLSNNKIKKLEPGIFSTTNLSFLDLRYNKLEHLTAGVFQNLSNLEELHLDYNRIRIVPSKIFENCPKLRYLVLKSNYINHIEPRAFSGLHLNVLDLEVNDMKVLTSDAFTDLRVDELFSLEGNKITEIEPQAFRNLTATWVKLCYIGDMVDRDGWGAGNSIEQFSTDRCDTELLIELEIEPSVREKRTE